MSPDGTSILYLVYPTEWGKSRPVTLMRMRLADGVPLLVLNSSIGAEPSFRCARHSAGLCIIAETNADHTQLVFSEVNPVRGRGPEIAHSAIETTADAHYSWDLSPDGTRIAILKQSEATIKLVSLVNNSTHLIDVKNSPKLYSVSWSSEGQGLLVSGLANRGSTLLHLDLKGNTRALWSFKGGVGEPGRDLFHSGTLAPRGPCPRPMADI